MYQNNRKDQTLSINFISSLSKNYSQTPLNMDTGGGGIGGRGGIDSVHTNGVSVLGRLKLQSSYTLKFLLFLILNLS